MKIIRIIALHLAYGGVEKAIINMANLFVEQYLVEIICVYHMPNSPAFPLDKRVKVTYLLKDIPNRQEWKASMQSKNPVRILKESVKSINILSAKKQAVKEAIQAITDGILITTRHEDNMVLSKYGNQGVYKIAQLHHDHNFLKKYVKGFAEHYQGIDLFALLTPQTTDEVGEIMKQNKHTKLACIPNFLADFPKDLDTALREKVIMAVGRLDPVKGFDRLVSMFKKIHEVEAAWKLQIVGEGTERGKLEQLITEYQLEDHVVLTGQKNSFEIEAMMKTASVYAMSSSSEGQGIVLLEAFSCKLPAIAFDVRVGPGAVINDGINGFLIPEHDEKQYISRLLELMRDQDLRLKMAEKAYQRSMDFSKEAVGKLWASALESEDNK